MSVGFLSDSRSAAPRQVSWFSIKPAGRVQKPERGSIALLHNNTLLLNVGTHPAIIFGFW